MNNIIMITELQSHFKVLSVEKNPYMSYGLYAKLLASRFNSPISLYHITFLPNATAESNSIIYPLWLNEWGKYIVVLALVFFLARIPFYMIYFDFIWLDILSVGQSIRIVTVGVWGHFSIMLPNFDAFDSVYSIVRWLYCYGVILMFLVFNLYSTLLFNYTLKFQLECCNDSLM